MPDKYAFQATDKLTDEQTNIRPSPLRNMYKPTLCDDGLTLYGHIKTTEQRTIIQQYGDWYTLAVDDGMLHLVQRGWAWAG